MNGWPMASRDILDCDGKRRPGGSQLGLRLYEELNFNGILRTLWEFLGNLTFIQEFSYFWWRSFGEHFGIYSTFFSFFKAFNVHFSIFR